MNPTAAATSDGDEISEATEDEEPVDNIKYSASLGSSLVCHPVPLRKNW
jgi:hypothetical protein